MKATQKEVIIKQMMDKYGDSIVRMCYLYLKDYHLAEDAAQETFFSAFRAYDRFENKSSEKTWLTKIAINQCKSIMRKKYFQMEREKINWREMEVSMETNIQTNSLVSEAVMKLSRKEREVILAYYYQELSVKEVAKVLGIKEAAAMQRLKRAREHLNRALDGKVVL